MPGVVMSLMLATLVAGVIWLLIGSRLTISEDSEQNSYLNFFVYLLLVLPFAIALAFFGLQ